MSYSCRASLLQPTVEFELTADGLVRHGPIHPLKIDFSEIAEITVFKERRFGSARAYWACGVRARGHKIRLTAGHRLSLLRTEDRTSAYIPFIKEFERRAVTSNPAIVFVADEYRESPGTRLYGWAALRLLALLGRLPRKSAASISAAAFRCVGPLLRAHRRARQQLTAALPALSETQAKQILRGMWDNIGRSFAEYPHIPELMRFSPEMPMAGQVIMDERTAETMRAIARKGQGALMFAAHLGNWEIPAMAARAAGCEIALVYKRQPSAALTDEMTRRRAMFAARLIEASPSAPLEIMRALRRKLLVGILVDQYYAGGIEAVFFGHPCRVNPLLARLALRGNWPVYGSRVMRLPDQRYQLEVVGPLELACDGSADAAMQTVIGLIEQWIRQTPEQWMWMHQMIR